MRDHFDTIRQQSRGVVVPSRRIHALPLEDNKGLQLQLVGPNGSAYTPTHWAFGQLAARAEAPAGLSPHPAVADRGGLHQLWPAVQARY